jgi:Flp pilus assembly protein TadG
MNTKGRKLRQGGQSLLEFTLVGIPVMFLLISIFEVSRGMWTYETLSHAVKQGVRYAIVHGVNCTKNGNNCPVNLGPATGVCNNTNGTIAEVIQCAGVGLDPATTTVTFTSAQGTLGPYNLNAVPATPWPPTNGNQSGQPITIEIRTTFRSAIAMFWPGAKPVRSASTFILPASSSDHVQF